MFIICFEPFEVRRFKSCQGTGLSRTTSTGMSLDLRESLLLEGYLKGPCYRGHMSRIYKIYLSRTK